MRGLLPLLFAATWVHAQDEFIPQIERPEAATALPFGGGETGPAGDDTVVLVERAATIALVGNSTGLEIASGPIIFTGLTVADLPQLAGQLAGFAGRPLTERDLVALTETIIRHYESHDRPVVEVTVTGVEGDRLMVSVAEGRVGELRLKETRYADGDRLAASLHTRPGALLIGSELENDLAWLSRNPFRKAELFAAPGAGPGEADLLIGIEEERPWRLSAGFENTGNEATGEERIVAGGVWGNAWNADHLLAYQATLGLDPEEFQAHGFSYEIPIASRREFLRAVGSWSRVRTSTDFGTFVLDAEGESWQVGIFHGRPVAFGDWKGEASWGAEFKRTDTFLAAGGTTNPGVPVEIAQARVNLLLKKDDAEWHATLAASPGGLTSRNHGSDFANYRPGADASYLYARAGGSLLRPLGKGWTLLGRGEAQLASGALLPSEQLGLGGYNTVRGYAERDSLADAGAWVSLEARTPALTGTLGEETWQAQGVIFLDGGLAWRESDGSDTLLGTGLGARFTWGHLSARADLAIPLDGGDDPRLYFGLTCQW